MKVLQEKIENGFKLILHGELTLKSVPEVESALKKIVQEKQKSLMIDMRKLNYVDSSGLRLLVNYHHEISSNQGRLTLFSPSQNVKKVLELTRLSQILHIQNVPSV